MTGAGEVRSARARKAQTAENRRAAGNHGRIRCFPNQPHRADGQTRSRRNRNFFLPSSGHGTTVPPGASHRTVFMCMCDAGGFRAPYRMRTASGSRVRTNGNPEVLGSLRRCLRGRPKLLCEGPVHFERHALGGEAPGFAFNFLGHAICGALPKRFIAGLGWQPNCVTRDESASCTGEQSLWPTLEEKTLTYASALTIISAVNANLVSDNLYVAVEIVDESKFWIRAWSRCVMGHERTTVLLTYRFTGGGNYANVNRRSPE